MDERVAVNCTECRYFLGCEPGALIMASLYGCDQFDPKEGEKDDGT